MKKNDYVMATMDLTTFDGKIKKGEVGIVTKKHYSKRYKGTNYTIKFYHIQPRKQDAKFIKYSIWDMGRFKNIDAIKKSNKKEWEMSEERHVEYRI